MLHLLGRIDANFLAQVADVVVDGFPQVSANASGEASPDAAALDQPIQGLLQPPTPCSDGMRFPADLLVGSAAAELEPGQDSGGRGVNEEEYEDGSQYPKISSSSTPPPPKDHLLDHMYFASPLSAQFEEEVATISPPHLDISLLSNDLMANVGADLEMESIPVEGDCGKNLGRDRGNRRDVATEKVTRGKRSKGWKETAKEKEARTRRAEKSKRRRRDSSSSSEETVSAAETDSAYDSPTSACPTSPSSSSSSSPPPSASPKSSQPKFNRSSPMLSSTCLSVTSPSPSLTNGDGNDFELRQKNDIISVNSKAFLSDNSSSFDAFSGEGAEQHQREEEEEEFGSTLDLDLLNSLLTKDILDEMGQVILDKDLGNSSKPEKITSSMSDSGSLDSATDRLGYNDAGDDGDLFAGIFGDLKMGASDGAILNDFDSTEWESTFNEFFPQLNI